ncbi:MAG: PilN domain-containing protein [Deltaproteobacteria bacterium]|nr:PilN domain-containing protein [Deltaproteobacteria bacterium]
MIQRINLLPGELRTVNKRIFYFISSLLIILYLSTLYVVNNTGRTNIGALEAKRDSLRQSAGVLARQDAKYREIIDKINMTEAKNKEMEARAGVVNRISGGNTRWSDPLYELSNIVPAGLWFSSLSSSDIMAGDKKFKGIRVSGMAFSSSLITDFMAALEASPYFEGVSLASLQNTEYNGREAFSFEITFMVLSKVL